MIISNISDMKPFSHKLIAVKCDSKISDKCVKIWKCKLSELSIKRNRNNSINDNCYYCSFIINSGRKSHFYKYSKDEEYFSSITSEDKSYFLGLIASDGHIRRKRFTIKLSDNDSYVLEYLSKMIKSNIPVHHKKYKDKMYGILDVSSMKMTKDLISLLGTSFGPKDFTVNLPMLNDKLTWHFLRGLFDGDGHINKNSGKIKRPRIVIASVSVSMKQNIRQFCKKFDIVVSIPKNNKTIQISGRYANIFINHMYKNCDQHLMLTRKYEECKEWKENWAPKTKKLNEAIAMEIRKLKNDGVNVTILTKKFKVGRSTIYNIINNKSYVMGTNK